MEENNKFFRFVWRFNGIILMITGLLAMGVLGFAGYGILQDITRERDVRNIVNVAENDRAREKWRLGQLEKIGNSPSIMIPLYSDQSYAQSYYGKSARSIRNILFINTKTSQKRWFLGTNDYLIANHEPVPERGYGQKEGPVKAILFSIVKKDTNGDKRLTTEDSVNVILSTPDGSYSKEILNDIDFVLGKTMLNNDTLLIVYQKKGNGYSANASLSDFSISNQAELPKIGKNS
jgi:hypothetical protein